VNSVWTSRAGRAGSGLVEHHDPTRLPAGAQRPRYGHSGALRRAQAPDGDPDVEVETELAQLRPGFAAGPGPPDAAGAVEGEPAAEVDVVDGVEVVEQPEVLVDEAQPGLIRRGG